MDPVLDVCVREPSRVPSPQLHEGTLTETGLQFLGVVPVLGQPNPDDPLLGLYLPVY
jgi:hypothetical protein